MSKHDVPCRHMTGGHKKGGLDNISSMRPVKIDDIKEHGVRTSKKRMTRIMHSNGIKVAQKLRFKIITDSKHDYYVTPKLLNREFNVQHPNAFWVSDISYIWTMESHMKAELIIDSLKAEEVFRRKYKTRDEARFYIFEYIAVFYNRKNDIILLTALARQNMK